MRALPVVALFALAAGIGLFMGVQYLRGQSRRPVMIGVHLLLALGGLEAFAALISGTPDGQSQPAGPVGSAALILFAAALMGGLGSALVRRHSRRASQAALAAHASAALAALALLLIWVGR